MGCGASVSAPQAGGLTDAPESAPTKAPSPADEVARRAQHEVSRLAATQVGVALLEVAREVPFVTPVAYLLSSAVSMCETAALLQKDAAQFAVVLGDTERLLLEVADLEAHPDVLGRVRDTLTEACDFLACLQSNKDTAMARFKSIVLAKQRATLFAELRDALEVAVRDLHRNVQLNTSAMLQRKFSESTSLESIVKSRGGWDKAWDGGSEEKESIFSLMSAPERLLAAGVEAAKTETIDEVQRTKAALQQEMAEMKAMLKQALAMSTEQIAFKTVNMAQASSAQNGTAQTPAQTEASEIERFHERYALQQSLLDDERQALATVYGATPVPSARNYLQMVHFDHLAADRRMIDRLCGTDAIVKGSPALKAATVAIKKMIADAGIPVVGMYWDKLSKTQHCHLVLVGVPDAETSFGEANSVQLDWAISTRASSCPLLIGAKTQVVVPSIRDYPEAWIGLGGLDAESCKAIEEQASGLCAGVCGFHQTGEVFHIPEMGKALGGDYDKVLGLMSELVHDEEEAALAAKYKCHEFSTIAEKDLSYVGTPYQLHGHIIGAFCTMIDSDYEVTMKTLDVFEAVGNAMAEALKGAAEEMRQRDEQELMKARGVVFYPPKPKAAASTSISAPVCATALTTTSGKVALTLDRKVMDQTFLPFTQPPTA